MDIVSYLVLVETGFIFLNIAVSGVKIIKKMTPNTAQGKINLEYANLVFDKKQALYNKYF